jgi:hypothetical protein
MHDPTNTSTVYGSGLASRNIELTMALRRDLCFLATHKGASLAYGDANFEFVEQVNYRTARYASRFIAGPSKTFPGADALLKEIPE